MDTTIETVTGKSDIYIIKHNNNGFYAEVRTRNKWKLLKERYKDYTGETYKHPQFMSNFYSPSLDSIKWSIGILESIK